MIPENEREIFLKAKRALEEPGLADCQRRVCVAIVAAGSALERGVRHFSLSGEELPSIKSILRANERDGFVVCKPPIPRAVVMG